MNYQAHYDRLVARAKDRILEGYIERHHTIPKCMGGTDDKSNIVSLTAREHFVAHQLLVKMYPGNGGLISAVHFLTTARSGIVRNNRMYEWLRKKHSISISKRNSGLKRSPETKKLMSKSATGRKMSEAGKLALSIAKTGTTLSAAHKAAVSLAQRGKKRGPYKTRRAA